MLSYCCMKGRVLSSVSHTNVDYGDCFFLSSVETMITNIGCVY